MDYLNRAPAQLTDTLWQEIDKAATEAARERLTGRRYLEMEGPFGVGLTAIEAGEDDICRQPTVDEASALSQTDGTGGQRSSLAIMASADLVQTKGLGLALCSAR
jgi:uncharacterized linocin/CFP29 family protein